MPVPAAPKIYHICHIDRLPSIVDDGVLWCDAEVVQREPAGTTIGMSDIKTRRLDELTLTSYPDLHVGACVPFYFCPRSVMLYLIYMRNHKELTYKGGQGPIVHLEADLHRVVEWAEQAGRRWAFTLSNAGSYYFEDRNDLARLGDVKWDAVRADKWQGRQEAKQAEFLVEHSFPWELIDRVGVLSPAMQGRATQAITGSTHRPAVDVLRGWYY